MVGREILANEKWTKSPKLEGSHPPKLVCMHFTSTPTCLNFLSQFYFLTPMDYSPWSEGKFWLFWRQMKNEQNLRNWKNHTHQNRFACISHQPLLAWIFWANSIFRPPWTIVHGRKGNFGCFEGNINVAISPKPERSHPPKSVCMHFTSTSTCMNFLSQFYFSTPMDYSPWSEGKFWLFWRQHKRSNTSETGEVTPTKIGLHAFHVDLYLSEIFELIPFFDPHGL